jgi:hypothetical protein
VEGVVVHRFSVPRNQPLFTGEWRNLVTRHANIRVDDRHSDTDTANFG